MTKNNVTEARVLPALTGSKWKGSSLTGADVRFLFPSGRYTLTLIGNGINLSAVGRGSVSATGIGLVGGGTLAVNGGKPQALTTSSSSQSFGGKST